MEDNLLINLKIIGLLEKNDKISINDELIIIDHNTLFQGMKRWWFESNRMKGIIFIETLINTIDTNYKTLIRKTKTTPANNKLINTIQLYLTNAVDGLENMKLTYKDDKEYTSKIDTINYNIRQIINLKK
uniref:Uncharacterized protein n=1 Tax=viral metagenome TaxID=1070528 RepID=A0A6C0EHW6_9ZZZZ